MSVEPLARYPCDLHCHTTRSDGNDSPYELIANAARVGLKVVAITDHDIDPPQWIDMPGGGQGQPVEVAASLGVRLVPGYEFSTNTWVDDVHICGYGLDWGHPALQAEVAAARRSKTDAYRELCDRLSAKGMPLDWEADVLTVTGWDGEKHSRLPDEVERKHIFEAIAARGYAESWSAAKLMVRDDPDLNVSRRKIDPIVCINLIHSCGGIASLAHPYLIDGTVIIPGTKPCLRREYIHSLLDGGLDGMEARYTYDKTTYKGFLTPDEIEAEVRTQYQERVRFFSGGSDYHAGHKKGEKKIRALGERGLTLDEFEWIRRLL